MDIGEILGRVGFEPKMALFSTINFIIVFLILKKLVFDKIGDILNERKKEVEKGLEDAKMAKAELSSAEAKAGEIIKEAKKEANSIVKKTQEDAVKASEIVKAEKQKEIDEMINKSKAQIEEEKRKMIEDIKSETADLALLATQQIINKKLNEQEDKKIIDEFLQKIDVNK